MTQGIGLVMLVLEGFLALAMMAALLAR